MVVPTRPLVHRDPTVTETLNYAKLDIIKPAEGEPQVDAAGNPILVDPVTGKVDPTLHAPKGQAPCFQPATGPTDRPVFRWPPQPAVHPDTSWKPAVRVTLQRNL